MRTKTNYCALLSFVLLFSLSSRLSSQETEKSFMVYPSFGFGIGFFYPGDVNDYIENVMFSSALSSYNTEIYMYLEVKGGLTFRLKQVDFSCLAEYDIAPKFVAVEGGDNDAYAYSRIAPEISANYYIPNKSGRNAFLIGVGINYSFMKFEDFQASAPGFKLQAGYSMQFGNFNLQPNVAFRYVKATDDDEMLFNKFELDYTGGQFGVILSFHPKMSYR